MDKFKKLHTALIDTGRGYEEAVKDAEGTRFAALFRDMSQLHSRHHAELHHVIAAQGETPDDSGSFMSTVHKVVIDMRAAITGLDEKALPAFISGEDSLLGLYDEALNESQGKPDIADILKRQKQSLRTHVARMKDLEAETHASRAVDLHI